VLESINHEFGDDQTEADDLLASTTLASTSTTIARTVGSEIIEAERLSQS